MTPSSDLTWRPLTRSDAPAWIRLTTDIGAADSTSQRRDLNDFERLLLDTEPTDTVAVLDGDTLVAYGVAWARAGTPVDDAQVRLSGGVAPAYRRRGVGRQLLERLHESAIAVGARLFPGVPVTAVVPVHESTTDLPRLLATAGYDPTRPFLVMGATLAETAAPWQPPDGLVLEHYRPEFGQAWRLLRNATFADHWGSYPVTEQAWRDHFTGDVDFAPRFSVHLRDPGSGDLAAFVLCCARPDSRNLAVVDVGTLRSWRGKGLAGFLLTQVMHEARAEGYETATLVVDALNPTGAVTVYERHGFTTTDRWTRHTLPLTPAG
ncbi:GNAT family N-acetyltransferase [Actinokineospora auranticolor]|uniref:Acetyltransferase (GNAT) family protein n=1 Tax=Actinokineospora auranticolor TaxID=155976 RepID=A0A2S6GQE7_9PSEU|nr:GNAT family N-acetyltransferase [Actinokineospora auranticolor]PPK67407.1 acetyltransferase (GNAT) family protein [Actinokineospora auranticolor]